MSVIYWSPTKNLTFSSSYSSGVIFNNLKYTATDIEKNVKYVCWQMYMCLYLFQTEGANIDVFGVLKQLFFFNMQSLENVQANQFYLSIVNIFACTYIHFQRSISTNNSPSNLYAQVSYLLRAKEKKMLRKTGATFATFAATPIAKI